MSFTSNITPTPVAFKNFQSQYSFNIDYLTKFINDELVFLWKINVLCMWGNLVAKKATVI